MITCEPGTTTLTRDGDIWVLTLRGEHDITTVGDLDGEMERIAASGTSVVIDLSPATFIDSQVLAWLLRWWGRSCDSTHLKLALSTGPMRSPVTRLFELVGLASVVSYYPTMTEALYHLDTNTDTKKPGAALPQ